MLGVNRGAWHCVHIRRDTVRLDLWCLRFFPRIDRRTRNSCRRGRSVNSVDSVIFHVEKNSLADIVGVLFFLVSLFIDNGARNIFSASADIRNGVSVFGRHVRKRPVSRFKQMEEDFALRSFGIVRHTLSFHSRFDTDAGALAE